MATLLIKGSHLINEGEVYRADILLENDIIIDVLRENESSSVDVDDTINASGLHILPGAIDDQVHFREPGLTHKANIYTEAKAAVSGGITSFMEMPNTVPNTVTIPLLEDKYTIASESSLANYSFFMGATNDNIDEVLKIDKSNVCGVKIFMGSSTGNMLVDSEEALNNIFSKCKSLIAVHCEDEATVSKNLNEYIEKYGEDIPMEMHPKIRSEEACYLSSSKAVALAKKHNTHLHILHISTAKELSLFDNSLPLMEKRITAEACIHHMWFDEKDYLTKGSRIKWNPAVKTEDDKRAILQGVLDNTIDVIATDHAPHTDEEKKENYMHAPSGGPLLQHSVVTMLELCKQGKITLERIVEKMCHAPADLFGVEKRGYLRKGYKADLVLVDLNKKWTVDKSNIVSKCQWSPMEGQEFSSTIISTFVNGRKVYDEEGFYEEHKGERLTFSR
ncbi:MAG: dihydroorotase [Flavobacteriales bacterium]|nr:dihydroorotase [Flavobacteriales bacterium]